MFVNVEKSFSANQLDAPVGTLAADNNACKVTLVASTNAPSISYAARWRKVRALFQLKFTMFCSQPLNTRPK